MKKRRHSRSRRFAGRKGNAVLELALALPIMMMICVGAADFGRMFYHAITLVDAAGAGASFGALRESQSGDLDAVEQMTMSAASDLSRSNAVTATASRVCVCPGTTPQNFAQNAVDCYTASCPGYGRPRVYVRVQTSQDFELLALYPGIEKNRTLSPAAYRRVQ